MSSNKLSSSLMSIHTAQSAHSEYKTNFTRILTEDFPQAKYTPRKHDENRSVVHYGQRKLFLSEVEFLTNVCQSLPSKSKKQKMVLIYAGAAPGNHIDLLSRMFSFIKFVLVDPAKFSIEPTENIVIKREFFTDEMSLDLRLEYEDYTRLFVSDIRRAGPGMNLNDDKIEQEVLEDMRSQETWYHNLKPFRSLLKFRPPYVENRNINDTKISYLDGEIYFQIWPPGSSSETRLLVAENAGKRTYDCVKYENQMFRFNTVERVQCYAHDIEISGLDHCYDCRAEVFVFEQYVKSLNIISSLSGNQMAARDVKDYIQSLHEHLQADKKRIIIKFNRKDYQVNFLDIRFGKTIEEICTIANEIQMSRKKWNYSNGVRFNFNEESLFEKANEKMRTSNRGRQDVKNRLDFATKRLKH